MGASCGGDVDDELLFESYKAVGLQAQHAYSVLDVKAVGHNRYGFVFTCIDLHNCYTVC